MLKLKSQICFFIFFSIILIIFSKSVFAQEKQAQIFRVSPVILNISLSPGSLYHYQISAENLLSIPLPLQASLENFDSNGEDGGYLLDPKNNSPLLNWITIENPQLILNPKTKENINLTVRIPSQIPIGGYFGLLFLQPLIPPQTKEYATSVTPKIGVLILANIGVNEKPKASINEFNFDKWVYEKGPVNILLRIQNRSLNFFSAKPVLYITPLFGQEKRYDIEEKFIFPGKIRRWQNQIDFIDYRHLLYKIRLVVDLGNDITIQKTTYILAFPMSKVLIGTAIILIIIFIIKKRPRLQKALKILVGRV